MHTEATAVRELQQGIRAVESGEKIMWGCS